MGEGGHESDPRCAAAAWARRGAFIASLAWLTGTAAAQEKPAAPQPPQPLVSNPLAALPGATTKIVVRGLRLDSAKEVRLPTLNLTAKLLSKGKTAVPNRQELSRVGDTQVEIELTLPADAAIGETPLIVVGEQGESAPHALLVGSKLPRVEKREPNDGFRAAQELTVPQAVDGALSGDAQVDVFALAGRAGQTLTCEVWARRHGSNLDALLTLYDAAGRVVASCDDLPDTADARLQFALPADGRYYLVLQDANDQGGPAHPYRLTVEAAGP